MDVLLEHYHRFFHGRATDTIELEFDGVELTLLSFVYPADLTDLGRPSLI